MPVFDTGYSISQDYIRPFVVEQGTDEDDTDATQALVRDIDTWWLELPRDVRRRTPLLGLHVPEGKIYLEGSIWFRTRRTAAPNMDGVIEIEADRIIKRRFLEVIGPKFDESQAVFFVQPWKRLS